MSHGSDTCIITAQLSETCDASSFKELIASSEYDFRFSCGVNKPVCRLQYYDKEKIIALLLLPFGEKRGTNRSCRKSVEIFVCDGSKAFLMARGEDSINI